MEEKSVIKVKDTSFLNYFVRSQRLAGWLMYSKGFIIKGLNPDFNYPRRNVFTFSNSENLRSAIEEYKNIPK